MSLPEEIKKQAWDFSGGPMVKTLCSQCGGAGTGSIPGLGTKIPHAARHGQKKKRKRQAWLLAMVSLCLPSQ